jgi:hypothetical protein
MRDVKHTISVEILRELIDYAAATGKCFWKLRPLDMFATNGAGKIWNVRGSRGDD